MRKKHKRTLWSILGGFILGVLAVIFANRSQRKKSNTRQVNKANKKTVSNIKKAVKASDKKRKDIRNKYSKVVKKP